jgi:exodeoxyribonuclease V alpha subunit
VVTMNRMVEDILSRAGLIQARSRWYRGQPIMVSRNDYTLRLFNGDVGLVFEPRNPKEEQGDLRAYFPREDGAFRSLLPAKLPEHETVYAMTVHKAQGSEFDRVLLLLPDRGSELLTRELVYTGITRARKQVEIWGQLEVLREAISNRIERKSGLKEALTESDLFPLRSV